MTTAHQAAVEIHQLMNARPSLPHVHELEAIIARAQTVAVCDVSPWHEFAGLKADLRRFLDENQEPPEDKAEHAPYQAMFDQLVAAIDAYIDALWSRPAVTYFDLLMRAEAALYHENSVMGALKEDEDGGQHGLDDRAMAHLIDAVVTVGRRAFGLPDDGTRLGDV